MLLRGFCLSSSVHPAIPMRTAIAWRVAPSVQIFFKREKARPLRAAPSQLLLLFSGSLEEQLERELHLPRLPSALDAAEIRSIRDTPVRVQELRMVKHVKKLGAELEVRSFSHACDFLNREIEIRDPGSATNGPGRVAQQLQRSRIGILDRESEGIGIEVEAIVGSGIKRTEWGN